MRYCNEWAYTQVALYGKDFVSASRDTWTLLVRHSGVDALVARDLVDLVATALGLASVLSGLVVALVCGLSARALFGAADGLWWEAHVAGFAIGYACVSLVVGVLEAAVCALYVCYAEDPTPLASVNTNLYALFISQPSAGLAPAAGSGGGYEPLAAGAARAARASAAEVVAVFDVGPES